MTAQPSVTDAVFERAVAWTLKDRRIYMPPVGEFLAICDFVVGELEREAERARQDLARPALAAPAAVAPKDERWWSRTPPAVRTAFLRRHVAIGKLRARTGRLLQPHSGAEDHGFTEQEIAAVLAEMDAGTASKGPLGDALPVAEVVDGRGEWPVSGAAG